MKKMTVVALAMLLAGSTMAVAAPGFSGKKIPSQIIQATQNTTVSVAGTQIYVPQGQTVIVGQRENGAILVRGRDLSNVKLNDAAISTQGNTVLSYYPTSNVAFLNRGETMTVTDALGHSSTVAQSGAISTTDAAVNSDNTASMKAQAEAEAAQAAVELAEYLDEVPAFVATSDDSAATEQAVQNVEETEGVLSPSAPR